MNQIRVTWNESLRAVSDSRVRVGAWITLMVLALAVFMTILAFAANNPLLWFLAGVVDDSALMSIVTLAFTVESARKAQDSEAMTLAASKMIAGFVAEELKDKGHDVEVTAGPEGITVRRRDPATTVH